MRALRTHLLILALGVAMAFHYQSATAQSRADRPDLPSKVPSSRPFLKINGQVVTVGQYVDRLSLRYGVAVRESLMDDTLIGQEAKRRKMIISQKDIRARAEQTLLRAAQQFGGQDELAEDLKKTRGWTLDQYRYVLRGDALRQLRLERIGDELLGDFQPDEAALRAEYERSKDSFGTPLQVKITHLLIRQPKDKGPKEQAAARQRAEGYLNQIVAAKGENLETLARQFSEDDLTRKLGGKFPIFLRQGSTQFGPDFEALVFRASPGLIPRLVQSVQGYHVVRVDERKLGQQPKFEEVMPELLDLLLADEHQERLAKLQAQLRLSVKVDQFQRF